MIERRIGRVELAGEIVGRDVAISVRKRGALSRGHRGPKIHRRDVLLHVRAPEISDARKRVPPKEKTPYSVRNASIGFIMLARRAGK